MKSDREFFSVSKNNYLVIDKGNSEQASSQMRLLGQTVFKYAFGQH